MRMIDANTVVTIQVFNAMKEVIDKAYERGYATGRAEKAEGCPSSVEIPLQKYTMLGEDSTVDTINREVVRCKDCRHAEHCHETVAHTKDHDGFREHWSEPIEWCSRGERREE